MNRFKKYDAFFEILHKSKLLGLSLIVFSLVIVLLIVDCVHRSLRNSDVDAQIAIFGEHFCHRSVKNETVRASDRPKSF